MLVWSLISAAFIGPGTVTIALAAGSGYQFSLLWALVFSVIGCFILQEGAGRVTISSGKPLGKAIAEVFANQPLVPLLIALAVVTGCVAYEAGNLIGANAGLKLLHAPGYVFYLSLIIAAMLLIAGQIKILTILLSILVAVMGVVFLVVAFQIPWSGTQIVAGLMPSVPDTGMLLVSGLVGTTIVPYNLFLGSGIGQVAGQNLKLMHIGLVLAVFGGGLITMAILVVGSLLSGTWDFYTVKMLLNETVGSFAAWMFSVGLFAAGLTSAITAPLAAQFTLQSLFPRRSGLTRFTGVLVLLVGFLFQVFALEPIPLIIAAQAFNGILLPFSAVSVLLILNDKKVLPAKNLNNLPANFLGLLVTGITIYLGLLGILKIPSGYFSWSVGNIAGWLMELSLMLMIVLAWWIYKKRR